MAERSGRGGGDGISQAAQGLDCRAVDSFCAEAEGTFGLSFMVWGLGFTLTKSGRRRFKVSAFTAEV